jgi:hypothetical protein
MIADAIVHFPGDPRRSLTIIVIVMVLLFTVITLEIGRSFDNILRIEIERRGKREEIITGVIEKVLDILKDLNTKATNALGIAERSRKFIDETEPGHMETHQRISVALVAIQHTCEVWTNLPTINPADKVPLVEDEDSN